MASRSRPGGAKPRLKERALLGGTKSETSGGKTRVMCRARRWEAGNDSGRTAKVRRRCWELSWKGAARDRCWEWSRDWSSNGQRWEDAPGFLDKLPTVRSWSPPLVRKFRHYKALVRGQAAKGTWHREQKFPKVCLSQQAGTQRLCGFWVPGAPPVFQDWCARSKSRC